VPRTAVRPVTPAAVPVPSPSPDPDEAARLQALYRTRVLDTAAEQAFDDLALLAAHVCGVPSAAVAFLDEDREWVKASVGIGADLTDAFADTDRTDAFCSFAVLEQEAVVVPDLLRDARTRSNPLVRSAGLRFYAGAPVRVRSGHAVGAVCVLDVTPRTLSPAQVGALGAVARQVAVLLEWRQLRPTLASVLEARRA
jgi:GAF domain-containing protein